MNDIDEESAQSKAVARKTMSKKSGKKRRKGKSGSKRTRTPRTYPALSFEQSLALAEAIHLHASGDRVARLTLLKQMNLSPTSSSTQILITSSGKYGITTGSYAAEHIELTAEGRIASDKGSGLRARTLARFNLAIKAIPSFDVLYNRYRGKKLPSRRYEGCTQRGKVKHCR